jgi:hypothetical protein
MGSSARLASTQEAETINRSAVIVRPKKPFLDVALAVDYDEVREATLEGMTALLYPMPDYKEPADADRVVRNVCEETVRHKLEGWFTNEDMWLVDLRWEVFKQGLDIQQYEIAGGVGSSRPAKACYPVRLSHAFRQALQAITLTGTLCLMLSY